MERKKGSRREAKLKCFVKTAEGDYVYIGGYYRFSAPDFRRAKMHAWMCAGGMAAALLFCGILPLSGLIRAVYAALPYFALLLVLGAEIWSLARVSYWGDPIREYVYQEAVVPMGLRRVLHLGLAALSMAGEVVYSMIGDTPEAPAAVAGFVLLHLVSGLCAALLPRLLGQARWRLA